MNPWLRVVRIGNVGVSFVGTVVGGLAASGAVLALGVGAWLAIVLAALSTAAITAGGNVLNDRLDVATDRTNHPERPLVRGEITLGQARALWVALFAAGAIVVVPILPAHPLLGAILVAAIAALLGYEFFFKAQGLAGNLVVAFLTAMVFLYGGAAGGDALLVVPFAGMAFLATLSREVIKDMEDAGGDVDRATVPRRYGMGAAGLLARVSVAGAIALSVTPLLWFVPWPSAAGIMYLALVLIADGIFVASVGYLPDRLHAEQTMSKVAMTVALFAFLAVAFR